MSRTTRSDQKDAQLRRTAVKRYRTGIPAAEMARQLHRSRSWVYKWVDYRAHHPWTRFRSAPRAPHHHPNQLSARSGRRIVRLRQLLMRRRQPRLRFASVGARAIQREWCRRSPEPPPSLRTIQRVLQRHHLIFRGLRLPMCRRRGCRFDIWHGSKTQRAGVEIAHMAWEDRDCFRVRLTPLDDAIRQAAEAGPSGRGSQMSIPVDGRKKVL